MKKYIIGLLAVLLFASAPVMAGYPGSSGNYNNSGQSGYNGNSGGFGAVDPNDKAVVTLLWMVYSDLQMCRASLDQSLMDNVSAIGHLNNAQSALKKSEMDPAYFTLISEIDKRIGKIKFYLVMNERKAVAERLQQLMAVIRNVLGAGGNSLPNVGNYSGYNPGSNGGFTNQTFGGPNGSGYVPSQPEIPVNGGQINQMPVLPSGVVPVR
ncbi:MAG: hypothetical protein PHD82_04990 [Candidatus Riflebacteria bacterium]|nr:hypothetical protein [Candidatus Riflebacteria bacterium]